MGAAKGVFLREATGLSREMSRIDAIYYNVLTCSVISTVNQWTFLAGPAGFPGGDVSLALLISCIGVIPLGVAYAMMAASMPRTGGEYIFQSRILHPSIGFSLVITASAIFSFSWTAWSVWSINEGLSAFLSVTGAATNNMPLLTSAQWLLTDNAILIFGIVVIAFVGSVLILGMKSYVRLQHVLWWGVVAAVVVIAVVCAVTSTATFAQKFNSFMLHFQENPDLYHYAIESASNAGFNPNPAFSLIATIGITPLWFSNTLWIYWSTYQAGEIKGAQILKNQLLTIVGAAVLLGVLAIPATYFPARMAGYQFINAMSYHAVAGTEIGSIPIMASSFILFASIAAGPILAGIVFFGFLCNLIQIPFNCSIAPIRAMFAMSFDRVLPAKVANVDKRFRSPWVATLITVALSLMWLVLFVYVPAIGDYFTVMMVTTTLLLIVSMLAAIVFPYRSKDIYKASPVSKYEVFGVPAVTVAGILGILFCFLMEYYYVVDPTYGGGGDPIVIALNALLIVGAIFYYFLARWYRKRQGIDIELAFKEVPPE
jgi:APA family basic amino acid/polyamine antiporter